MLNLLFDFSYIYDIILLVVIALIVILLIKFKSIRVFLISLLFILFVGISCIAGFQINNYYSASGGIRGELQHLIKPSVEVDDLSFSLQNLTLLETGKEDEFALSITTDKALNLSIGDHIVYINDVPCNIESYSTDYISCVYDYVFYNENLEEVLNDKLFIKFSFWKDGTSITVSTNGGTTAVGYWNYYFNQNKFVVTIK